MSSKKSRIEEYISESIRTVESLLGQVDTLESAAEKMIEVYKSNKKVIVFGNGGSAADAQHIATELEVRFRKNRKPLRAISLTTNTSMLTAIGNDYSFDNIFERQVESQGEEGDVAIAISTSGDSENVIKAAKRAGEMGITVIAFTGPSGGKLKSYADILLNINSSSTSNIQEGHTVLYHILCDLVEAEFF